MDNGMQHEMMICETFPSGAQEWFCPTCGRRYVMQWPPKYSKVVLVEGDTMAIHVGGTGTFQFGSPEAQPHETADGESEAGMDNIDDPYLSPFSDWMNNQKL